MCFIHMFFDGITCCLLSSLLYTADHVEKDVEKDVWQIIYLGDNSGNDLFG